MENIDTFEHIPFILKEPDIIKFDKLHITQGTSRDPNDKHSFTINFERKDKENPKRKIELSKFLDASTYSEVLVGDSYAAYTALQLANVTLGDEHVTITCVNEVNACDIVVRLKSPKLAVMKRLYE